MFFRILFFFFDGGKSSVEKRKAKKKKGEEEDWGPIRNKSSSTSRLSLRGYYFIKVRKKKLTTERIHDQRLARV